MALPQVSTPTYELTVPSSGEKVSYRPFLVKEEKILMMAMESGDTTGMTKAMKDIITSCTDGEVDTKDLAPYDLEYFFLQLRGRSVGETIEIKAPRPPNFTGCCDAATDEDTCQFNINVDDVQVDVSKVSKPEIQLTDTIGVKMLYPQIDTISKYSNPDGSMQAPGVFEMIIDCIEYIWDEDEIFQKQDHSKKEINAFLESLNSGQFKKIQDFFEGMPRLKHDIDWVCPHCNKKQTLTLQGIDAFFG